jgi:hypothetical protein
MAEIGEESGVLEERESQLIENKLDLKGVYIRDIFTPRSVVFRLDADRSIESVLEEQNIFVYSRIPVYEKERRAIINLVLSKCILTSTSLEDAVETCWGGRSWTRWTRRKMCSNLPWLRPPSGRGGSRININLFHFYAFV